MRPSAVNLSSRRGIHNNRRPLLSQPTQWLVCLVVSISVLVVTYQLLWTYWLAGVFVPDVEVDPVTGQKRIRRRPDLLVKKDVSGKAIPTNPFDAIMEGHLTLIDIILPTQGLLQKQEDHDLDTKNIDQDGITSSHKGVQGVFCHISWERQARDPSTVPMFRDLQKESPLCRGTTITVTDMDLHELALKARQYDHNAHNFTTTAKRAGHQAVPPTAVVFHETRCGSTLVSNMLASSLPDKVRSFSESPPPLMALMACDVIQKENDGNSGPIKYCDPEAQQQLIQDVFYLMGRITRVEKPQFVFYKMQSIGTRYINLFTKAMPSTPWAFIFRDSVEILMSHFKNYQNKKALSASDPRPVCLRSYGNPQPDPRLQQIVDTYGANATLETLTKEDYCAAHLATLAKSALDEYRAIAERQQGNNNQQGSNRRRHRNQWFFNYNQLPHAIWEDWLPRLHMGYITGETVNRMQQVANLYSKTRLPPGAKGLSPQDRAHWHEDSTMKRARAPDSVKEAAKQYLDPLYQEMQAIQNEQNE